MNNRIVFTLTLSASLLGLISCGSNTPPSQAASSIPPTVKAELCSGADQAVDRLFLQQVGSNRAIIKWRNTVAATTPNILCFGTDGKALPKSSMTTAKVTETDHREVLLTGLQPDTEYFYSVGGAAAATPGHSFRTAPITGRSPANDGNVRMWVLGDPGTSSYMPNTSQVLVRNGYYTWVKEHGGEPADMVLMLGDNGYLDGADNQLQRGTFDIYPAMLASAGVWPTIGNHEMGSSGTSTSSDSESYKPISGGIPEPLTAPSRMPYLNIYSLPTQGEVGGVPSGTEKYYSFNYGNVHVVSLDSQITARDKAGRDAMADWLKMDLGANSNDWTVVMFHHPPYSKGTHDTDNAGATGIDQPEFDMREQFTPILEAYGVDVVYGGHSHVYERSFYISGHTGLSSTFNPKTMAELNDQGKPASGKGNEEYSKITRSGRDDKVVYTTAGNSGQDDGGNAPLNHPAHYFAINGVGSVVIDASKTKLTAHYITGDARELDFFSITR